MRRDGPYQRFADHPDAVDAAFAAGLFLVLGLVGTLADPVPTLLAALMLGPLAVRRRYPLASAAAFAVAAVAAWVHAVAVGDAAVQGGHLGAFVVIYTVAAHGPRWASRTALAAGLLGAVVATLSPEPDYVRNDPEYPETPVLVVLLGLGMAVAFVVTAWTLGDSRRVRQAYVAQLEERARRLEVEREQEARLAASAERARIAREMHDVVAHSLAVVIAQADGGQYAADDAAARQALVTVAATGRSALADMRRLLGVLRAGREDDDAAPAATAPQPDVDLIPDLVDGVRHSGVAVDLEQVGEPRPLPAAAGLAAYRIVQEALTNVLKHAGPGARTTVAVDWAADALQLRVSNGRADDGAGAVPRYPRGPAVAVEGPGHGLAGMRERAALFGGSLSAGPSPDGGFRVDARLPYPAGAR